MPAFLLELIEDGGEGVVVYCLGVDGWINFAGIRCVVFIHGVYLPGERQKANVSFSLKTKADEPAGLVGL